MEALEALLLDWYPISSQSWSYAHPRGLLSGSKPGTTSTEFTRNPQVLFIRRDNGQPNQVVNVFDNQGQQLYSIERSSRYSTLWTIYQTSTRAQIAKIKCGLFVRTVSFLNKPSIHSRQIGQARWLYGGLPSRAFYLDDGAPYEWRHSSQYLERIINPGGGHEEIRQRLARVKLLRSLRFDWEVLIDPEFDQEIALATVFISMLTEWSTAQLTVPGARTAASAQVKNL